MYNQFLDAREKLKNVEPLQKILDAFSRNCRTFVKHHLFDQVWWLGITARMHQKNFTGCVCFRSYQLCALPFCHAWRHVSAANDFPDAYEKFMGGKFAAQLTKDSKISRIETEKVIEMTLNKNINTPGNH